VQGWPRTTQITGFLSIRYRIKKMGAAPAADLREKLEAIRISNTGLRRMAICNGRIVEGYRKGLVTRQFDRPGSATPRVTSLRHLQKGEVCL
jgi:hypothetical protein